MESRKHVPGRIFAQFLLQRGKIGEDGKKKKGNKTRIPEHVRYYITI